MLTKDEENTLDAVAGIDMGYQQILREFTEAEAAYLCILDSLGREERGCLEYYVSRCRELEARRTCLAFRLGSLCGNGAE